VSVHRVGLIDADVVVGGAEFPSAYLDRADVGGSRTVGVPETVR